jgi:Acyclic terpene utilisation family protein AtuA
MGSSLRIGGGAGFINDRLDAALELVERGGIEVLQLEMLAERTLAQLQSAKAQGGTGYAPNLAERFALLLPACAKAGVKLVANAGGANPKAAGELARQIARRAGHAGLKVATVGGDDVADLVAELDPILAETGAPLSRLGRQPISANAYIGAAAIAEAMAAGAEIVLTGRVADPSLTLGPALAKFGWRPDQLDKVAAATMAGHLIECSGQATGGYFAEPGFKEVPELDRLGFPIAEIAADGTVKISKPAGSGGRIDRMTITEQLLYELGDPAAYLTPDVTLDVTDVEIAELGPDLVRLRGARGKPAPATLKVLIGADNGWLAEVEISYAGFRAEARARLAADIAQKRLRRMNGIGDTPLRVDLIGVDQLLAPASEAISAREVRLRLAWRAPTRAAAEAGAIDVETLYTNGPAGGGGVRWSVRHTVKTFTAYLPRELVRPSWSMEAA